MKRKALSKKTRQLVYEKYHGHCAYCGCELAYKDMQVDHVDPCYRNDPESKTGNEVKKSADELNQLDNLMPSCRMCNFYKSVSTLEAFSKRVQETLLPNVRRPFQFRLAEKYGLVEVHEKPIRFYFEEAAKGGLIMSKPNEATAMLLKLAAENPAMPIVAMVNFEVVAGDEFAYWTGEIDNVDVKELWLSPDARTWDREDAESEWDGFIESYASNEELMKIECWTDDKLYKQAAMEWIAGLPWTKCIVIFVETPDELTRKGER